MNEAEKKEERKDITCTKCGTAYSLNDLVQRDCVQLVTEDKKGFKLGRPLLRACCPNCCGMWEYNLPKEAVKSISRQLELVRQNS